MILLSQLRDRNVVWRNDDRGGNGQGKMVRGRGPPHCGGNRAAVAGAGCGESGVYLECALGVARAQQAKSRELRAAMNIRVWYARPGGREGVARRASETRGGSKADLPARST